MYLTIGLGCAAFCATLAWLNIKSSVMENMRKAVRFKFDWKDLCWEIACAIVIVGMVAIATILFWPIVVPIITTKWYLGTDQGKSLVKSIESKISSFLGEK